PVHAPPTSIECSIIMSPESFMPMRQFQTRDRRLEGGEAGHVEPADQHCLEIVATEGEARRMVEDRAFGIFEDEVGVAVRSDRPELIACDLGYPEIAGPIERDTVNKRTRLQTGWSEGLLV